MAEHELQAPTPLCAGGVWRGGRNLPLMHVGLRQLCLRTGFQV